MFESRLKEIVMDSVLLINEPLANHTTMKIGGPAEYLVIPKNVNEIKEIVKLANEFNIKVTVIGRGSNLLVSDNGIEGIVIKVTDCLDHIDVEGTKVLVGAGYSVIRLATQLSRKGLSGLEFASGIPGSVGGAVYMNAGAHQSDFSNITSRAHILFQDGTMEWLTTEELEFSYRTSVLQKKRQGIVLEAELKLQEGTKEVSTALMQKNKDYRRETQPWNFPCAGSIFRNPLPQYAGNLIEKANLKGYQIGGAKISEMHGNFIINAGNATARDVLALIQHVKDTIYNLYEIRMETEVEIIGRK